MKTRFTKIKLNVVWISRSDGLNKVLSGLIYYTASVLGNGFHRHETDIGLNIIDGNEEISSGSSLHCKSEIVPVLQVTPQIILIVCIDNGVHKIVVERDRPTSCNHIVNIGLINACSVVASRRTAGFDSYFDILEDIWSVFSLKLEVSIWG